MRPKMIWPHGTVNRYNKGCTCDECRQANRIYKYKLALGHKTRIFVSPTYARNHIQFLLTNGWSLRSLAAHTGFAFTTLQSVASGRTKRIEQKTEQRILATHTLGAPYEKKPPHGGRTPLWLGEPVEVEA